MLAKCGKTNHGNKQICKRVTFQWAKVQLLAKLGGWEPHKDRKSGKFTLMRGLSCLFEMLVTQAIFLTLSGDRKALAR
jgi:hypothetical protein